MKYPRGKAIGEWFLAIVLFAIPAIVLVVLTSIAILLADSKSHPFFTQIRVGKTNGKSLRTFRIFKMRTMVTGWKKMPGFEGVNGKKRIKLENDPRLIEFRGIRVGYFIRKLSLDEVPQILNVLLFQMSFVGPRPPQPFEIEEWREEYPREVELRLLADPGVTGLAQVSGRDELSTEEKLKYDAQYVETMSLWNDIKIWFKTIGVVISGEGAY